MSEEEIIHIDGNFLEGGGQIVRTSLGLSAVLGKGFEIDDIRQGRKQPGLKAQHLTAITALRDLCGAETSEVELGTEKLRFVPGKLEGQTLSIDIGTAGSITLLLQSLWAPLILGGRKFRLKIKGGTDTKWSMPMDYLKEVFIPQIRRYADIDLTVVRRGFYPKGQGEIDLKVKGKYTMENISEAPPIDLDEQGHLMQVKGISFASTELQKAQVAERQANSAKRVLASGLSKYDVPIQIRTEYVESSSVGTGVVLWAIFSKSEDDIDVMNPIRLGADALGERGKKAEVVGEEAAKKLLYEIESGAVVDQHMMDNMVPFVGLFGGKIKSSQISDHSRTNIYSVEKFLGECLEVKEKENLIMRTSTPTRVEDGSQRTQGDN